MRDTMHSFDSYEARHLNDALETFHARTPGTARVDGKWSLFPVSLSGHRVRLREFDHDDLRDSVLVVSDDRVTRSLSFDSLSEEQQRHRLGGAIKRARNNPREEYYLAVTTHGDDRLLGFCRLGLSGVRAAKLGFAIAYDQWGNGYATDAARTMTSFGFTTLELHRITAAIGPDNATSIAVTRRIGFTHEGRLRDHVYTNGAWRDSELYSILAHEWPGSA